MNPDAGKIKLRDTASRWLAERPNLRPRTVELYESVLRLHILPTLGDVELSQVSSAQGAHLALGSARATKPGKTTVAKCYRLLRSIMETALEDGLIDP